MAKGHIHVQGTLGQTESRERPSVSVKVSCWEPHSHQLHLRLSPSADQSSLSHTEPLDTGHAEEDSVKSTTCAVALGSADSLSLGVLSLPN